MHKKDTYPIYIYNPIEDEWPLISSFPKEKQKKYIRSSNRFADCYLFANSFLPTFTLITPIPLDQGFVSYFHDLTGSRCTPITPKGTSPFICENIRKDSILFGQLLDAARTHGSITIYSYAISKEVFLLIDALKKAGAIVYLPEGPQEKDLWTVAHFGSKCGFRKSFPHLMPKGSMHRSHKDAIIAATTLFATGEGVVVKTDRGNAGEGVFIFKKNKKFTNNTIGKHLKSLFVKHPYLKKHSLVVEEFIDTTKEKRCPFPSIECFIHQDGRIEIPYFCNMIVSPEGEFYGMEMHKSVFTDHIRKNVFRITREIARVYRENGYRGRFDIDMICDGTRVYADESNTRINGGTDTYMVVKKVIGSSFFSTRYVFAHYLALSPAHAHTLPTMLALCKKLLFDPKTKRGLIINSGSAIASGGLSYIIVEKTKKDAFRMHERLKTLLEKG